MAYHVALSALIDDYTDPRCFLKGTPAQVYSTMTRCWTVEPTSERIVEDITSLPDVLRKIVAAEGTIVLNEGLRHGRRAERHNGNGLLTTRLTTRQRKDLLQEKPLHPDLHQLREEVLGIGNNADVVVDMMNVQHEEHEQRDQQLEELEEEVEQEFLQELAGLALGVDQSAEVGMEVN
jgi:hypothetical protein